MSPDRYLGLTPEEALRLAGEAGERFGLVRTFAKNEKRRLEETGSRFEDRVIAVREGALVVGRFRVRLDTETPRRS